MAETVGRSVRRVNTAKGEDEGSPGRRLSAETDDAVPNLEDGVGPQ